MAALSTMAMIAAGAAAAGTAISARQGHMAAKDQRIAGKNAEEAAAKQADEAVTRQVAEQRRVNNVPLVMPGGTSGAARASTLLTGPAGVDPQQLTLGRTTLLGG
ncbi:MAG TPA: hypothetical protein VEA81_00160 [Burkholderiaceae bacterium]|nr:hypothetical protein [Burkholderiaceae bacterium]